MYAQIGDQELPSAIYYVYTNDLCIKRVVIVVLFECVLPSANGITIMVVANNVDVNIFGVWRPGIQNDGKH